MRAAYLVLVLDYGFVFVVVAITCWAGLLREQAPGAGWTADLSAVRRPLQAIQQRAQAERRHGVVQA